MKEEELKARLERRSDEIIEQMMKERQPKGSNSLEDIEELAMEAGRRFREEVLQALADAESEQAAGKVCKECGQRMLSRGKRLRTVISRAGEVKVKRRYYVCPVCGNRSFPPG